MLQVTSDTLWQRICRRLEYSPYRRKFNEHKREWMDATVSWYESREWDYVVDNSTLSMSQIVSALVTQLPVLETNNMFTNVSCI